MKNHSQVHVIGIPVNFAPFQRSCHNFYPPRQNLLLRWMNKFSRQAGNFTREIRDHVSLGPKISETVKGKLTLGIRILHAGGIENVFRRLFDVSDGEKLLKASQCHLWTSAGPISGLLFISTERVAFHSDRPLTIITSLEEVIRNPYKVVIPMKKVKSATSRHHTDKPKEKYIQIVTVDEFEFWFTGCLSFQRSLSCLRMAMLQLGVHMDRIGSDFTLIQVQSHLNGF